MKSTDHKKLAETRYEQKMPVTGWAWGEIQRVIKNHRAGWREHYPERKVHSVYWDTEHWVSYSDHVLGVGSRFKTRLRWYGENEAEGSEAALELKIRKGRVGLKERYDLGDIREWLNGKEHDLNLGGVTPEVRAEMSLRRPVVWISYQRQYWLSRCGRFRMTTDRDIHVGAWRPVMDWGQGSRLHETVIEIKYELESDIYAPEIFQDFPFRVLRMSKYVKAIESLG